MTFIKGQISPNSKLFQKGVSGNPKGKPKKLFSQFREYGYKPSQIQDLLETLIGLNRQQLEQIEHNEKATILERILSRALLKDFDDKTFITFQPLVNRIAGMPKQQIDIETTDKTEIIRIALELYRAKINQGLAQDIVINAVLALVADKTTVRLTARELLAANSEASGEENIIEGEIVE